LPHIKAIFESKGSDSDLIEFYHTLTDAWYTRLKTNELSVDTMISLAVEIMENTMGFIKAKYCKKAYKAFSVIFIFSSLLLNS
jgi:hypothetical protein